jgi:hypothetical protein
LTIPFTVNRRERVSLVGRNGTARPPFRMILGEVPRTATS